MPFIFHIDHELQITYLKIYQHCLWSDLARMAVSPVNTERPRVKLMIFDFLDGELEIELEAMQTFTRFIRDLDQAGFEMEPTAILTNNQLVASFFGTFNLIVNESRDIRQVFGSLDEALAWSGMLEHAAGVHQIRDQLLDQLRVEVRQGAV